MALNLLKIYKRYRTPPIQNLYKLSSFKIKMAEKTRTKTRYIDINVNKGNFVSKLIGTNKSHDFSDIKLLRNLLSNEKARILYTLKTKKPRSIYELAKLLKRDPKSVRQDIKILKRFGFIEFHSYKKGNRQSLSPVLTVERLELVINI